jgi:hypothetical protein
MRATFALLTAAILGLCSCGGADNPVGSSPTASSNTTAAHSAAAATTQRAMSPEGYLKYDNDIDPDYYRKGPSNDDQSELTAAGRGASRADRRAIAAIVKSYYTAAADEDGAKGCSLLHSSLATVLAEAQGRPTSGGGTCAASLSLLFRRQHQHLAADDAKTMVVTGVHVKDNVGLATLGFRTMPETEIVLEREGSAWKIDALYDSPLP